MGTRNLTMVINKKGELKVAQYGQWDGYPSGQGAVILEFAKDKDKMKRLEQELDNIKFFNKCEDLKEYIKEYDERCASYDQVEHKMMPDKRTEADMLWYERTQTRDLGGEILDSIISLDKTKLPKEHNNIIYLFDDSEFGQDSLMCEWAYCINFQTNKLECFEGFNEDKSKEHQRFATIQEEVDKRFDYTDSRYYGMRLIKEYDLDNLPDKDTFIKDLD